MAKKNNKTTAAKKRTKKVSENKFKNILAKELINLEGIHGQNPETGAGLNKEAIPTYLDQYTNRIFGAPYQFMDSVDGRYKEINKHLGHSYLKNVILNSPILHITPGMPYYTGGASEKSIISAIKYLYFAKNETENNNLVLGLLNYGAKITIFSKGAKLQKRMFGFREDYYQYMSYVNYMCRSTATFLNLTSSDGKFPDYILIRNKKHHFESMDWSYYRMLDSSKPKKPWQQLKKTAQYAVLGKTVKKFKQAIKNKRTNEDEVKVIQDALGQEIGEYIHDKINEATNGVYDSALDTIKNMLGLQEISETDESETKKKKISKKEKSYNVFDVIDNKVKSVLFMVDPVPLEETLTNTVRESTIESLTNAAGDGIGSELAFITNSKASGDMLKGMVDFLGDGLQSAAQALGKLMEGGAGGFASNLVSGAIGSIRGQRMIYPKIYESSNSEMNYSFSLKLSTPYGDVYHYFVDILVPLFHLIGLVAPRMISSNSVSSPYLVQAFIPGQCTCQLGIISNMQIKKNPEANHVSIHGYPLEVEVTFTIQELYNAMAISPANDPASFLFNETLNDYMSNLAGLIPATEVYTNQRENAFKQLDDYFASGEWYQDLSNRVLKGLENFANPYVGR